MGLKDYFKNLNRTNESYENVEKITKNIITLELTMDTGKSLIIELYPDIAPITVENFIKLVNQKFYNGLTFHRVIKDFMIQGGCPNGTGTGGLDYTITGEFLTNGITNNLKHERGVISMARSANPNSANCQFFIMLKDSPHLDGQYAAFGKVLKGMEVVDEIGNLDTDYTDKPLFVQRIKEIVVYPTASQNPQKSNVQKECVLPFDINYSPDFLIMTDQCLCGLFPYYTGTEMIRCIGRRLESAFNLSQYAWVCDNYFIQFASGVDDTYLWYVDLTIGETGKVPLSSITSGKFGEWLNGSVALTIKIDTAISCIQDINVRNLLQGFIDLIASTYNYEIGVVKQRKILIIYFEQVFDVRYVENVWYKKDNNQRLTWGDIGREILKGGGLIEKSLLKPI